MERKIKQVFGLAYMRTIPTLRNPIWFITISLIPISMMFIFWVIGGRVLSEHAMIGGIITITANGGIVALPQEVIMNKYRKFQSICVSSPITPFIYYMGVSLSRFFYILPPLFIISFMLGISGLLSNLMLYILIILFIFLIGSMLGFAIATHLSNPMYIGAIANMLGLLLCLLPPVYYPLTLIPSQYRLIIMLVPTVSAAHLMRIALGIVDASMGELVSLFSVLLIYLIVSIFLVKEKAEWREK